MLPTVCRGWKLMEKGWCGCNRNTAPCRKSKLRIGSDPYLVVIDRLQKLALRIRPLQPVAIGIGVLCLAVVAGIILTDYSQQNDRYLLPAIAGALWSLSAWVFINTFQSVPGRAGSAQGIRARFKRKSLRAWYWLLALVFLATTVVAVFLTLRLSRIWFSEYY